MKKFICALLSLAMLALFAGCRDQKNIETDTTDAGLHCTANRFRIRIH